MAERWPIARSSSRIIISRLTLEISHRRPCWRKRLHYCNGLRWGDPIISILTRWVNVRIKIWRRWGSKPGATPWPRFISRKGPWSLYRIPTQMMGHPECAARSPMLPTCCRRSRGSQMGEENRYRCGGHRLTLVPLRQSGESSVMGVIIGAPCPDTRWVKESRLLNKQEMNLSAIKQNMLSLCRWCHQKLVICRLRPTNLKHFKIRMYWAMYIRQSHKSWTSWAPVTALRTKSLPRNKIKLGIKDFTLQNRTHLS
jgi:hypothetical protein